tara:strand:- start:8071 stop:8559 length:489 start_codon:yes stop_codon:yes gene_type:complete
MEAVQIIPMRTTTLRKYIKEKSDARISKTAILHIRNSIETFIDKLNRQLLIDRSGKSEKTITATQIQIAYGKTEPSSPPGCFIDQYFPKKPIHVYIKQKIKDVFCKDTYISQDALFAYQNVIEIHLSRFVTRMAGQMRHAKRKTIQDADVMFCSSPTILQTI